MIQIHFLALVLMQRLFIGFEAILEKQFLPFNIRIFLKKNKHFSWYKIILTLKM